MVVDDDPQVLSFLKSCLETVAGHRVMESASAAEAVEICAGYCGGIHLLITDVNLAVSQGIGLARQACGLRPGMRVLFISGADNAELVANGLLDRNAAFLQKPFTMTSFLSAVQTMLA